MSIRQTSDQTRLSLKAAVRHALKLAGGGDSFQNATRVNAGTLSKYASPEWVDYHIPLDVALDLDLDASEPVCVRALAAAQGYDLVAQVKSSGAQCASPLSSLGGLAREHADLINAICVGAADGEITEAERRDIRKEAHELQSEISRLLAALEAGAK